MKKIIFILFALICIILLPINIYGKNITTPEKGSDEFEGLSLLSNKKSFNYIKFINDDEAKSKLKYYNSLLPRPVNEQRLEMKTEIKFFDKNGELLDTGTLSVVIIFDSTGMKNIKLCINDSPLINIMYIYGPIPIVTSLDIHDLSVKGYDIATISDFENTCTINIQNLSSFSPNMFYVLTYREMGMSTLYVPKYSNLDANVVINSFGLVDDLGNRLTSFKITEGDPINSKPRYELLGMNKNKVFITKTIIIDEFDISKYGRSYNFKTTYNKKIEDIEIINALDLKSSYESVKIYSEYHYAYNKCGKYQYLALIDTGLIKFYIPGYIEVVDNDKPYARKAPKIINATNDYCMTKAEILNNFEIYDDHDGIINASKITLDGLSYYLGSYNTVGEYPMTLKTTDSMGNSFEYNFVIKVNNSDEIESIIERFDIPSYIDKNAVEESSEPTEPNYFNEIDEKTNDLYNPVISNSDYVILAYRTHRLTSSEVQDLLISEGYLNNSDNVIIESDYFRESNPSSGSFSLSVTYENGDVTYYEINLVDKEEEKEEEKSYTGLIVSIVIGGIVLVAIIIIVVMKVYVHGKKN